MLFLPVELAKYKNSENLNGVGWVWDKYLSPPNIALAHPGDWSLLPAGVKQHGERVVLIETDYRPTTEGSVTILSYLMELGVDYALKKTVTYLLISR